MDAKRTAHHGGLNIANVLLGILTALFSLYAAWNISAVTALREDINVLKTRLEGLRVGAVTQEKATAIWASLGELRLELEQLNSEHMKQLAWLRQEVATSTRDRFFGRDAQTLEDRVEALRRDVEELKGQQ